MNQSTTVSHKDSSLSAVVVDSDSESDMALSPEPIMSAIASVGVKVNKISMSVRIVIIFYLPWYAVRKCTGQNYQIIYEALVS